MFVRQQLKLLMLRRSKQVEDVKSNAPVNPEVGKTVLVRKL